MLELGAEGRDDVVEPREDAPARSDSLIGSVIDNYLVTEVLREGQGGRLYLATHPALGKRAAIKVMRGDAKDPAMAAERFFAEGRAASQVSHENVVSVFNFGRLP